MADDGVDQVKPAADTLSLLSVRLIAAQDQLASGMCPAFAKHFMSRHIDFCSVTKYMLPALFTADTVMLVHALNPFVDPSRFPLSMGI